MKSNFLSLFPEITACDVPGLIYIPNYITKNQGDFLLSQIDQQNWLNDLKRRVQHYGYKYDYKARSIDEKSCLGPLPKWLIPICNQLFQDGVFTSVPDQVIVNEYLPGQGISAHIDCTPCFKDIIVSLSLGSSCIMELSNLKTGEKQPIFLEECSLVILKDDARYTWQHAIPARKTDIVNGKRAYRQRRVSLTFRNVILVE